MFRGLSEISSGLVVFLGKSWLVMSSQKVFVNRNGWLLLLAAMLPGLVAFVGCKDKAAAEAKQQTVPKVTTLLVTERETTDMDEYSGNTEASEIVEVRSRVFGFLKTIKFQDGQDVVAGDDLFIIEPEEYQAIHNQSLSRIDLETARLDVNKAKLARRANLVNTGAVSKEEYEEAIADVKTSEAQIAAAKADAARTYIDLKYTVVKAPISGRIDRSYVSQGNLLTGGLSTGTLLTKIVQEQPMYVYIDVDERSTLKYMRQRKDVSQLPGNLTKSDIKCYLKLADEKEYSHVGQIEFVSNQADTKTGTTRIRASFPNKRKMLASGMFVRLLIPVSKPYTALMIPESAIGSNLDLKFVYVIDAEDKAQRRTVSLGKLEGSLRVIKDGLKPGEQIIYKGLQRVRPEQQVEATLAKPDQLPEFAKPPVLPTEESAADEKPATENPAGAKPEAPPLPSEPAKPMNPVPPQPTVNPARQR
jgi:RND family efflux transporter MFP subunit